MVGAAEQNIHSHKRERLESVAAEFYSAAFTFLLAVFKTHINEMSSTYFTAISSFGHGKKSHVKI